MGKQDGNLWDDSALIHAFDDAMSSYKKIHSKKTNEGSTKEEKVEISTGEPVITKVDEHDEAKRRQGDADGHSSDTLKTTAELGQTTNNSEVKENDHVDLHVPEPYLQAAQDAQNDYSCSQVTEDYNQLLNQYYEVEEKRQKLLVQLQQFGGWNYQYSGEGSGSVIQGYTDFSSQQHALPTCNPSNPAVVCSCCPYLCQCLMTPCTSVPSSLQGGSCAGKTCTDACLQTSFGRSVSLEDDRMVKTAMGTAERALSSMKTKISGDSDISEDKKDENREGEMAESTSSETDLTAVFNAWYSAGFYTGKYLMQQSVAKKRHG
ncbi:hypothetical protein ACFX2I_037393 [Malus domestica]|uniref:Survival Motor Neuron Gemin2-binding domain-containing protein n=1 Tax=Malus domestica TaxID=3750 RepID=A0A498JN49_MALDO|nr:hypothetical protein DVH24_035638 [Malus domestica]